MIRMIKPPLRAVHITLFVLVQGERRKYKGLYSSMFVVGKINHCPVYRCILFYLAVYIVYIRDKNPNSQHLVFLDVKEVASVGQKQPINTLCTLDVKIHRKDF